MPRPAARWSSQREYEKRWKSQHKERRAEQRKLWSINNPEKEVENARRTTITRYGITEEQYDALLAAQGEVCAICGTDDPGGGTKKFFSIDHDHVTGRIRGLLCHNCNCGLGHLKDDVLLLKRAVSYLSQPAALESQMPRGVYDRSNMKAKRAAAKAVQETPTPKKGKTVSVPVTQQTTDTTALYYHLQQLGGIRSSLTTNAGHNSNLLDQLDREMGKTLEALTSWRESTFPTADKKTDTQKTAGVAQGQGQTIPTTPPAPIQVPAAIPAPPLPFTPENVQQVMKQNQS